MDTALDTAIEAVVAQVREELRELLEELAVAEQLSLAPAEAEGLGFVRGLGQQILAQAVALRGSGNEGPGGRAAVGGGCDPRAITWAVGGRKCL